MANYIGIIHKDPNSDYGVSFPDFPGCVTAGSDLDEARRMAVEALEFHIQGMVEDGDAIPAPSSLEAVMSDPDFRDGVAVLVSTPELKAKAVRINITLPSDLLEQIDTAAEGEGYTRSGFLARAARKELSAA